MTTYEDFQSTLKSDPRVLALVDFIFNVYPKREYKFSTSLTTCGICTTPEEELVDEAIEALYPNDSFPNWSEKLPTVIYNICETHAKKQSQLDAATNFLIDATVDLLHSNLYSSDMDELEQDV